MGSSVSSSSSLSDVRSMSPETFQKIKEFLVKINECGVYVKSTNLDLRDACVNEIELALNSAKKAILQELDISLENFNGIPGMCRRITTYLQVNHDFLPKEIHYWLDQLRTRLSNEYSSKFTKKIQGDKHLVFPHGVMSTIKETEMGARKVRQLIDLF